LGAVVNAMTAASVPTLPPAETAEMVTVLVRRLGVSVMVALPFTSAATLAGAEVLSWYT
jgi:hypothetical protein